MTLIKRKQLDAIFDGYIQITGISASGGSTNISTALSTALASAGRGGVAVPVQVAADVESVGLVAASRVEIYDTNGDKISDGTAAGNDEVYGRITESGGVYTLTYYTNEAGTETAYSFGASTTITIELIYRYDFARLPAGFAVGLTNRNGSSDPSAGGGAQLFTEALSVTGTDTIADLTKTPNATANVILYINGIAYDTLGGGSADFSVASKSITWSAVNAGFSVVVGDRVLAQYTTLE